MLINDAPSPTRPFSNELHRINFEPEPVERHGKAVCVPKLTEAAAAVSATRMLRNAKVIAEIEKRRAVRAERLQIDGDAIVAEANMIAMADMPTSKHHNF